MNAPDWWITLDRVGFIAMRILLSTLWQSSILLATAALLACALSKRRASARHKLWMVMILALPVIPILSWVASSLGTPKVEIPVIPPYSAPQVEIAPQTVEPTVTTLPHPAPAQKEESSPSLTGYPWAWAFGGYTAGVVLFLALIIIGRLRMGHWVRNGRPVTDRRITHLFRESQDQLGLARNIAIIETKNILAPLTIRTFHPVVLLPVGFGNKLSNTDLGAVAIHEFAHIKRNDPLILLLVSLVRVVFFFHPLVWLAARRVSQLAESACDDAVLDVASKPIPYAKVLASIAENLSHRALLPELAAGILCSKSEFLRRVEDILSDKRDQIRRLSRLAMAGIVIAGIISLVAVCCLPLGQKADKKTIQQEEPSVITDPTDRKNIRGSISIATIRGKSLTPASKKAVENLGKAINEHTKMRVEVKELSLDDPALFKVPFIYIGADTEFTLTKTELANLEKYIRSGGFVLADNGQAERNSEAAASFRDVLTRALGKDARFLPPPNSHPLYHCFYDFNDGPPLGTDNEKNPVKYLEGIWLEDRLTVIYCDKGYGPIWEQESSNEEQLKMGINMVVFAIIQEGSIAQKQIGRSDTKGINENTNESENIDKTTIYLTLTGKIRPGTVRVLLNGKLLKPGKDYRINYLSGILTLFSAEAKESHAQIEVRYESLNAESIVITDPMDRKNIRGSISIATIRGKNLTPASKKAMENLGKAINEHTKMRVEVKELSLDDPALFKAPFIYIGADTSFTLTKTELANLEKYLHSGGFVLADNWQAQLEYGKAEASLRDMFRKTLGKDARSLPIPNIHLLYHCFYDIEDEPPLGTENKTKPVQYLEGIWLDKRLVAIYSDKGYGTIWAKEKDNEPQLKMGINMVVFAVIQEGSIAKKPPFYRAFPENSHRSLQSP